MATNKPYGDGRRQGSIRNRTQVKNPVTNLYVERNTETGKFINNKTSGGPFKGVRREK